MSLYLDSYTAPPTAPSGVPDYVNLSQEGEFILVRSRSTEGDRATKYTSVSIPIDAFMSMLHNVIVEMDA